MNSSPDIWTLLFEQTPIVLRFALGVLTLGIFTLLGVLYRWNRRDMEKLEKNQKESNQQIHARINTLQTEMNNGFQQINQNILNLK